MRAILLSILGGVLLCLAGCSGGSEQVEIPKNPTPAPKGIVPASAGGSVGQPAPTKKPAAAPVKK
jgi:hypothetical protein